MDQDHETTSGTANATPNPTENILKTEAEIEETYQKYIEPNADAAIGINPFLALQQPRMPSNATPTQTANILKVDAEIEPNGYAALSPQTATSLSGMSLRRFDNLNPF